VLRVEQDPDGFAELRLFLHLAGSLRFARTSEACHVSPSALSRSIARLERQVGHTLFERDHRSVALTPYGSRFADFVGDVLEGWDRFRAAEEGDDEVGGTLSLHCTVTASQSILPDVLHDFRRRHPSVHLELSTGDAADALARLDQGTDVAVAVLPARPPAGIRTHVIARTPLVPVAWARALPDRIEWERTPFVLPSTGTVRALIDGWFRRHGRRPVVGEEAHGHEAVLSLVTLGCGIGIVPELVVAKSPLAADLVVLRARPKLPEVQIAVCTLATSMRRPAVRAFWETLPPSPPAA
jgi:LysR family transcriptional regulator, positive regulator for ilvC